ncbi:hypothetical protein TWF788_000145 [Orbilia oligospora]|uniref:CBM-cenC domain-containing protein n=1 Tax=Orbilia oligospora TaxID=2813651 RepID=A0A7C8Q3W4_ORBOL|nr:hypothetical protein TWF788_000145 [Orbilia oligospora]
MRNTVFSTILLASIAYASPLDLVERGGAGGCNANNCLRAIRGTTSIGLVYCSSYLDIRPEIEVVYETVFTITQGETTEHPSTFTDTITITTGTAEATITPAPAPVMKRDEIPQKAISNIENKCSSDGFKITSACNCLLSGRPKSTVTYVDYTWASETVPTLTQDLYTVVTTYVEAKVTYLPLIKNPGFDDPTDPFRDWIILGNNTGCDACTYEVVPNDGSRTSPNALKVNWVGERGVFMFRQEIPVEVGKKYKYKFQYKIDSPSRDNAWIPYFLGFTSQMKMGATNEWQTAESAPEEAIEFDTMTIQVSMYLSRGAPDDTERFYFDSFQFWEIDE